MSDPEEYYEEYRSTDDEDDRPADGRVIAAKITAIAAYATALAWLSVAVVAWFAFVAIRVVEEIGIEGFAVVCVIIGIATCVVGRAIEWYADRRRTKLELQAVEDGQWGENA